VATAHARLTSPRPHSEDARLILMEPQYRKPTLVFFQYKYDSKLPEFLLIHKRDHVKCLEEFFDVVVIDEDCNFVEICDKYEPELALFESGLDNLSCTKPKITNIHACPSVPKVGLHNADAFSGARAGFLSDMDHWGIETFFAISCTAAEHTPDIADRLFVWPNFIDTEVYRDYKLHKSIPLLLTGNTQAFYPWRHDIFRLAREHFPALTTPHPGYAPGSVRVQFLHGANYAQMINASFIVPTCGTVAKDVVRKHLEIPACRACLVTEESPALRAAGFVDMQNCVFAERHTVVDKLTYLFAAPEVLHRITDAGYQLAQSAHTMRHRGQIYQWLLLHKSLRPGQRIVQQSPFDELKIAEQGKASTPSYSSYTGAHLKALYEGHAMREQKRYEEAAALYLKCLTYMQWLPEARLGMALCELHANRPQKARGWLEPSITYILNQYKAKDPDPVEWAYYIISFLCSGRLRRATELARSFETLRHPVLDRTRWAVAVLAGGLCEKYSGRETETVCRATLHPTVSNSFGEWWNDVISALTACGQGAKVRTLEIAQRSNGVDGEQPDPETASIDRISHARAELAEPQLSSQRNGDNSKKQREAGLFRVEVVRRKLKSTFRRQIVSRLHRWEVRYGSFLPYGMSAVKKDEFCAAVHDLACQEEIKAALVIGSRNGSLATEAFLSGAIANNRRPVVLCLGRPLRKPSFLKGSYVFHPTVKWYGFPASGSDSGVVSFEHALEKATKENGIDSLDALVLDGSSGECEVDAREVIRKYGGKIKLIVVANIRSCTGYKNYEYLLSAQEYQLSSVNVELRNGYAIFRRHQTVCIGAEEIRLNLALICGVSKPLADRAQEEIPKVEARSGLEVGS